MISKPLKLGFLSSGNGSSARAICEAIHDATLAAEALLMVSNKRDATALVWAAEAGVPTLFLPTVADPQGADARLADALQDHGVELVILSGYLRHLGPITLNAYAGRVLNIHPGPLPQFGGEGMYGARVHQAVIAAGVTESAIVVHHVDEVYDRGPEIARQVVAVLPDDTAQRLEARIRGVEPPFFVETLTQIVLGSINL